ncbi:unnamed protein product, partial [Adineta ricciae]
QRNVWRGVIGDFRQDLKKNEVLTWWNVSSCSSSVDIIKDFLSSETKSTLFLIEAINGKDISLYTNYADEEEILLAPGVQLRIVAHAMNLPGGLNVVHLAEINDDDQHSTMLTAVSERSESSQVEQSKGVTLVLKKMRSAPQHSRKSTLF